MNPRKLVCGLLVLLFTSTAWAQDPLPRFNMMTEEWKPYNFEEEGLARGIAVDLLLAMLEKAGSTQTRKEIQVLPWARAYTLAQREQDSLLFTTTRSPQREKLFKWVGPIFENRLLLFARKDRGVRTNVSPDLGNYVISTYLDDAAEEFLIGKWGIPLASLDRTPSQLGSLKKVHNGRTDLFPGSEITLRNLCAEAGFDPEVFEPVFTLSSSEMCYAFHPDTPDSVIVQMQGALDELRLSGFVEKLFIEYGTPWTYTPPAGEK